MITAGKLDHSIGIRTIDAKNKACCSNLVFKNTVLPTGVKQNFCCTADKLTSMDFEIYSDDSMETTVPLDKCQKLGNVSVNLPEGIKANTKVEAVFTVGLNGLFIITLVCNDKRCEGYLDL